MLIDSLTLQSSLVKFKYNVWCLYFEFAPGLPMEGCIIFKILFYPSDVPMDISFDNYTWHSAGRYQFECPTKNKLPAIIKQYPKVVTKIISVVEFAAKKARQR